MFDETYEFKKRSWIQTYIQEFFVPEWLAEEKFRGCDVNENGVIKGQ